MLRYEQAQVDEKMSKDKKEKMSRRAALILRLFNAYNNAFCKGQAKYQRTSGSH